jgi:exonuclease III
MNYTAENNIDITCIQEPYTIQQRVAGVPKSYKTFTAGEARSRAAVIITNRGLDAMLLMQFSDADTTTVEITSGNLQIIIARMYLGRNYPLEPDLAKIEAILQHAKGVGVIIAMDSNAKSTLWYDTLSNDRGKILEEFISSKQLYTMNEASNTTFCNRIGNSNIELTLINSQLLRNVSGWEISDEESNSDHSIIKYDTDTDNRKKAR